MADTWSLRMADRYRRATALGRRDDEMTRAKIPQGAKILVEVGTTPSSEVGFDPFGPFKIL